jgi:hypothetical protein
VFCFKVASPYASQRLRRPTLLRTPIFRKLITAFIEMIDLNFSVHT